MLGGRRLNDKAQSIVQTLKSTMFYTRRDAIGLHRHAMLRENGVVLVCAGAIGSPQLLLLRGIWGIPVAFHSPYVAQYLNDNLRNGILIPPPIALEHSSIQVVSITELGDYVEAASNLMPFASPAQSISIRTPSNLHHFISLQLPSWRRLLTSFKWYFKPASTYDWVNPIVRFNYLSNSVDIERCIHGTKMFNEACPWIFSSSMNGLVVGIQFSRACIGRVFC